MEYPTPEQIARKAALLGESIGGVIDLRRMMQQDASAPLPVLYARGIIDQSRFDAGQRFAWLYWRCIGEPWPRRRDGGTSAEDIERDKRLEGEFNRLCDILQANSRRAYNHFAAVVVDQEWPLWLVRYLEAKETSQALTDLLDGFAALVNYRERGKTG